VFTKEYYEKLLPYIFLKNQDKGKDKLEIKSNSLEAEYEEELDDGKEFEPVTPPPITSWKRKGLVYREANKYNEETLKLIDQAEDAKHRLQDAESKMKSTDEEITTYRKKLKLDFGPNSEYISLIEKCFEFVDRDYTYKLCPFDKTVQKSKTTSSETSLGKWSSWDIMKKYKIMRFERGQSCWNGPDRSTKVHLTCGIENKITAVSEPNRCEYEFKFETPCACNEGDLQKQFDDGDHDEL
jgi:protein kinase C substrate 80K-H